MAITEKICLKEWRQDLLKLVRGDVLEIGAGTGANLKFYPETELRLIMSEPDKDMRRQLITRVNDRKLKNVYVSAGSAENIEAKDESFDFVVAFLVCCSVINPETVFLEIRRVLKPGGDSFFWSMLLRMRAVKKDCGRTG